MWQGLQIHPHASDESERPWARGDAAYFPARCRPGSRAALGRRGCARRLSWRDAPRARRTRSDAAARAGIRSGATLAAGVLVGAEGIEDQQPGLLALDGLKQPITVSSRRVRAVITYKFRRPSEQVAAQMPPRRPRTMCRASSRRRRAELQDGQPRSDAGRRCRGDRNRQIEGEEGFTALWLPVDQAYDDLLRPQIGHEPALRLGCDDFTAKSTICRESMVTLFCFTAPHPLRTGSAHPSRSPPTLHALTAKTGIAAVADIRPADRMPQSRRYRRATTGGIPRQVRSRPSGRRP